ncbi:hypothetical protein OROMI_031300 [Orobanche minor]
MDYLKKKTKRASVILDQFINVGDEAEAKFQYQTLMEKHLELQKELRFRVGLQLSRTEEAVGIITDLDQIFLYHVSSHLLIKSLEFVSRKNKLQAAKQKKETILAEILEAEAKILIEKASSRTRYAKHYRTRGKKSE